MTSPKPAWDPLSTRTREASSNVGLIERPATGTIHVPAWNHALSASSSRLGRSPSLLRPNIARLVSICKRLHGRGDPLRPARLLWFRLGARLGAHASVPLLTAC